MRGKTLDLYKSIIRELIIYEDYSSNYDRIHDKLLVIFDNHHDNEKLFKSFLLSKIEKLIANYSIYFRSHTDYEMNIDDVLVKIIYFMVYLKFDTEILSHNILNMLIKHKISRFMDLPNTIRFIRDHLNNKELFFNKLINNSRYYDLNMKFILLDEAFYDSSYLNLLMKNMLISTTDKLSGFAKRERAIEFALLDDKYFKLILHYKELIPDLIANIPSFIMSSNKSIIKFLHQFKDMPSNSNDNTLNNLQHVVICRLIMAFGVELDVMKLLNITVDKYLISLLIDDNNMNINNIDLI